MGTIWVAEHLVERKEVAVKFIWKELADADPKIVERFNREAKTLKKLDSPHVVKLYERGNVDGQTPFIVMELLHGETLVDRLERDGRLPIDEINFIVSQMGAGMQHIHERNIIHRDLKGENIFLLGSGQHTLVKILDFGLSKKPNEPGEKKLTAVGTMVGTAEYMSPEQILSSKDVDHRADLWAFAVLVYIMLVASLPFQGGTMAEVFMAVRTSQYTLPSALREGLPDGVDAWFARAFHMDVNQRFQTASEMNEAWQRAFAIAKPAAAERQETTFAWVVAALAAVVLAVTAALFFLL